MSILPDQRKSASTWAADLALAPLPLVRRQSRRGSARHWPARPAARPIRSATASSSSRSRPTRTTGSPRTSTTAPSGRSSGSGRGSPGSATAASGGRATRSRHLPQQPGLRLLDVAVGDGVYLPWLPDDWRIVGRRHLLVAARGLPDACRGPYLRLVLGEAETCRSATASSTPS